MGDTFYVKFQLIYSQYLTHTLKNIFYLELKIKEPLDFRIVMHLWNGFQKAEWCVYVSVNQSANNGLSPARQQVIVCTNAGILSIGPLGTIFSEILIIIHIFSSKKAHLQVSSVKCRPFCLGLNVLMQVTPTSWYGIFCHLLALIANQQWFVGQQLETLGMLNSCEEKIDMYLHFISFLISQTCRLWGFPLKENKNIPILHGQHHSCCWLSAYFIRKVDPFKLPFKFSGGLTKLPG